jgi:hypothetical protein
MLVDRPTGAQEVPWRGPGVCEVGDVDSDGAPDALVAHRGAGPHPAAWILSGTNGTCLRVLEVSRAGMDLGHTLAAAGDVDLDGVPDAVVVGRHGELDTACVYSGANGAIVFEVERAACSGIDVMSIAAGQDWNADGRPDVALTLATRGVEIVSGTDGVVIARTLERQLHFAQRAPGLAFLPAPPGGDAPELLIATQDGIWVCSGPTGAPRLTILGASSVGHRALGLGDVDGDGWSDFASSFVDWGANVYSGRDGCLLRHFNLSGAFYSGRANSIARIDVDGDARSELLLSANEVESAPFGCWFFDSGGFSIASATEPGSRAALPYLDTDGYGVDACAPGDIDHDGVPELVLALHPGQGSWNRVKVDCDSDPRADSPTQDGCGCLLLPSGRSADDVYPEIVRSLRLGNLQQPLWEVRLDDLPLARPTAPTADSPSERITR